MSFSRSAQSPSAQNQRQLGDKRGQSTTTFLSFVFPEDPTQYAKGKRTPALHRSRRVCPQAPFRRANGAARRPVSSVGNVTYLEPPSNTGRTNPNKPTSRAAHTRHFLWAASGSDCVKEEIKLKMRPFLGS